MTRPCQSRQTLKCDSDATKRAPDMRNVMTQQKFARHIGVTIEYLRSELRHVVVMDVLGRVNVSASLRKVKRAAYPVGAWMRRREAEDRKRAEARSHA
jgi:hypothetical protein